MKEYPILFTGDMVRANRAGKKRMTRRVVDMDRLKVVMRREVRSDLPEIIRPVLVAPKSAKLRASLNLAGAVSCTTSPDRDLGLKPGEFDFVCPYAQGETVLATAGGKHTWTIIPHASSIWVRESFLHEMGGTTMPSGEFESYWCGKCCHIEYVADGATPRYLYPGHYGSHYMGKRPSIHMPRWACGDVYTVTKVRIERLWDITEEDAIAEGCMRGDQYFGENSSRAMSARQSFMWLWQIMYDRRPGFAWLENPWVWVVEYDNPLWEVV